MVHECAHASRITDNFFEGRRGLKQRTCRAPCLCSTTGDAMQRICSRALALLICAVMFVGLIGARSLSPATERNLLQANAPSISLLPAQNFATEPQAKASTQAELPIPQADNRSQKDELMAELRSAAPVERFQA